MTRTPRLPLALAFALALAALPASAGTMSIAWDPVSDSDLAGYRVYYGSSPGVYTQSTDVGNVTETTLNLADCQTWYVAVKAYDTAGNESDAYSNEVSGWPRPVVSVSNPNAAEAGSSLTLTVDGSNFQSGAAVLFSNSGITVNSVTVVSCTRLQVAISIASNAPAGAGNIEVENPDQVFGTGVGLFTVQAAVAPTVSSTFPADGATGISTSVRPTITFSEAMLASSITPSTVRLIDDAGAAVPQGAGSPALSADGRTATITPAAELAVNRVYKIEAVGGASGVMDLAGNAMASTYRQPTGFRTANDTTAPAISGVSATNVGSTTARIVWTTDEPSDSRVYYRRSGETGWQLSDLDPAMVTSHGLDLRGLVPSTTYQYYVRSADPAGNASSSNPPQTFATSANGFVYIRFEAESGSLASPVRSASSGTAFSTSYIDTPPGTPGGSPSAPAGTATFGFHVPSNGTWFLWVRMFGSSAATDSWFESVDGAARSPVFPSSFGTWQWVAGRSYTLTTGLHDLELGGREAEARIDRVLITNDPGFVPTEQPVDDQTPPGPVTSLTATPADRQVTLDWTNPGSDYRKTVIRYRTDGRFPVSPADGLEVTEKNGTAGAGDSHLHDGLTNGVTYSYSLFVVDAAGNASVASSISATPGGNGKPGKVNNARRTDKKPPRN